MQDIKFSDAEKEETMFKDTFFRFGVHKVQIDGFMIENDESGRVFATVGVIDPTDSEIKTTIRAWLHTEGARKYTFNTLRSIYIHNAPADKKDDARKTFDTISDGTELAVAMEKVLGGEAWIDVYPDPDRTYPNAKGETKHSINTNIYGYEPKLKPELIPDTARAVTSDTYPADEEPFGTHEEELAKKNAGGTVPSKW